MIERNRTKEILTQGSVAIGCFLRFPSASLAELMGFHGWDFLFFDGEHGTIAPRDCEELARAAEIRGVTPVARVPSNNPLAILQFLDAGMMGVHVPLVQSAADAMAAVRSAKYQPLGDRGLASVRAAGWAQSMPVEDYVEIANRQTLVVVHVETATAVERVDEIARSDQVDVVFVGPIDLSNSLGVPGKVTHPLVKEAVDRVVVAVRNSPAALGVLVGTLEAALEWRERGATYISVNIESLIANASRRFLSELRT